MNASDIRGRFVWHELLTTDPDAGVGFYTGGVGWGTAEWEGGETRYTLFTAGETPVAGAMRLPEEAVSGGARPHWLTYVGVPDTDDAARRAAALGAGVLKPPADIPEVGRFAVITDPHGATLALHTPEGDVATGGDDPGIGDFSWHELVTPHPEAALDFYAELFGWEETETMEMGPDGIYRMYGRGDVSLGGIYETPDVEESGPSWLPYVRVPSADDAAARIEEGGGTIVHGPMEVPGGDRIAQCIDPQGAPFAVHSTGG